MEGNAACEVRNDKAVYPIFESSFAGKNGPMGELKSAATVRNRSGELGTDFSGRGRKNRMPKARRTLLARIRTRCSAVV